MADNNIKINRVNGIPFEDTELKNNVNIMNNELTAQINQKAAELIDIRTGADGTSYSNAGTAVREQVKDLSSQIKEKANNVDLAVERTRIDSFTRLAEGSTTGDAELIDARIGADGITYNNLGQAIREQLSNLSFSLFDDLGVKKIKTSTDDWEAGYYKSTDGLFYTSNKYISYKKEILLYTNECLEIIPPEGYNVSCYVYSNDDVFESGTSYAIDEKVILNNMNKKIKISIGKFNNSDANTYINDEFINKISIKKHSKTYYRITKLEEQKSKPNYSVSMFNKIGLCGASWDSGYVCLSDGTFVEKDELSWGKQLSKRNGNTFFCFARHSVTVKDYITNGNCLPKLLKAEPLDLYILNFGGNDSSKKGLATLGTPDDITTHADSFYGNYANIIDSIKNHAPNSKIILSMYYDSTIHTDVRRQFSEAVTNIASIYDIPRIKWEEDKSYLDNLKTGLIGNHPTIPQLSIISFAFERLFDDCVKNNYDYFCNYITL